MSDIPGITNSAYEPIYLSREHEWKNQVYFPKEELEYRVKNFKLADNMLNQLVYLLRGKDVDTMTIRHVLVQYIEEGTLEDPELHDFDKKVVIDCRAKRREQYVKNDENV